MAITASEARKNLFPLIERVNADHEAVEITSKKGSAFLVSEAEWRSMQETAHLLRSPANRKRLEDAMEEVETGTYTAHELAEP